MKPALNLRLHQQLALTPQLQQAIRLLQLSSVELEMELREALESNPLLELPDEPGEAAPTDTGGEAPNTEFLDSRTAGSSESTNSESDTREPEEDRFEPLDTNFDMPSRNAAPDDEFEPQEPERQDLRDHLLWQLNLTPMSARDRAIAVAIIEGVDDDGYLHEPVEAIQQVLASLYTVNADEIEAVRHRVQRFDPLGVASRNLRECLLVQLDSFEAEVDGLHVARAIVADHLEVLAKNDRARLSRTLKVGSDQIDLAVQLIRALDPKPGSSVASAAPEYVAPDAYAFRHHGQWQVSLAPGCQPQLAINRHYESLIARAQRDDASYLRGQLQEARWLIKSLKTRADTILKVAQAIVRAQSAFLDYGPEAMKPLVLKDVAEEIGMHESTVSRVTTRKFLYTPRGTYEFKFFFSSGVSTVDGGSASATAIQAMIRKLIEAEPTGKPLSDQGLAEELNRRGINVARRTVAKYREAMNIAASNERCRLS
ncbi:MAG: RNA polymerase sigma-54 factor [Lysobacterales bacterium 69-70]|nr:RNA polymerase factor sigma-54 [Xanthomonadaceae bacterium]ODU36100.1 MAG: RNA polymerase sigma-54 factor [Xanthomonadaceae bacterium SCN 69-320]ODV18156.1 MAG: RNA polymerase sigma-54 factor [Xanthomonadaceae bacterium SCN 69-25]OJY99439.1 MAG: RNA polymerase sigma-54 factor [Xanthomonadales bacterium 69-70]